MRWNDPLQYLLGHGAHHVGIDIAGRDGVDRDALGGAFLGQRLGEAVDAGFGGSIVHLAVLAALAVDRADVDDAAELARPHAFDDGPGAVEAGRKVGADDIVPVVVGHPVHGAVPGDAGIVDQDINWAEIRLDPGDAFLDRFEVADVKLVGLDAGAVGKLRRPFDVAAVVGRDRAAGLLESNGNRFSDATGAARDQCYTRHDVILLLRSGAIGFQATAPCILPGSF